MHSYRTALFGVLALALSAGCGPTAQAAGDQCRATAQQYWKSFRQAVMAGDAANIAARSRFPIAVEGTLDEKLPAISKGDFARRLPELLDSDTGLKESSYTMRQLVGDTAAPEVDCDGAAGSFRVGNMAFERVSGEWRLVKIYTE